MALELYDIMGSDMLITALKMDDGSILTEVVSEETNELMYQEQSHPFAWDSLVYFAKQIISENERLESSL